MEKQEAGNKGTIKTVGGKQERRQERKKEITKKKSKNKEGIHPFYLVIVIFFGKK